MKEEKDRHIKGGNKMEAVTLMKNKGGCALDARGYVSAQKV